MQFAVDLLDKARAAQGNVTDYRIAKLLGIHPNSVGAWRRGIGGPSNPIAMRLSELAGLDPVETVIALNLARATSPEDREVWEMLYLRCAKPGKAKKAH